MTAPRLLCVSNGHGEDAIALRILLALRDRHPNLELAALPLVGEGTAFRKHGIAPIAATKTLPSGGFVYLDGRQLARDLKGGLVQLTIAQLQAMRTWAQSGGAVLAVGDLIPAGFARWSGCPYAFVGTAKSAYYLRNEAGRLPEIPWYAGWAGSIYLPWERWLMGGRCRLVVVRDELTAAELRQCGVRSLVVGNPMMDGLEPTPLGKTLRSPDPAALTLVLLPGSRPPEAYQNWDRILRAVASVLPTFAPRSVHLLGAIAPSLDLAPLCDALRRHGWTDVPATNSIFIHANGTLRLTQTAYADCLHLADAAIAMAGTATEQVVGLGKPAFTLPGDGPQFVPAFARLQTRLLGPSVQLLNHPAEVGAAIQATLADAQRLAHIRENGQRRLGKPGAAAAIAAALSDRLLEMGG